MNERIYIEEIEGLMVEIAYEYVCGSSGDDTTPPTEDRVTIKSWKLADESRDDYPDYDDEEWQEWMRNIDRYVRKDSKWDIIEYEHDLEY